MKFYLDFEASPISNHIISIGCISETNKCFHEYVNINNLHEKEYQLIKEITNIDKEQLNCGLTPNDAFNSLKEWVAENNDSQMPVYICYGNNDKNFIQNTLHHINDFEAFTFATSIYALLIDFSKNTKNFFHSTNPIGLNRIYNFIVAEENIQRHDALDDAIMLKYVAENLDKICKPEDVDSLPAPARKNKGAQAPDIFRSWTNGKGRAFRANTKADKDNWKIHAYLACNNQNKYFDDIETAALWLIKYFSTGLSAKNPEHIEKLKEKINNAIVENKKLYGMEWEINNIEKRDEN